MNKQNKNTIYNIMSVRIQTNIQAQNKHTQYKLSLTDA